MVAETPADRLEGSGEMVRLEGQRVLREGGQVKLRVLCLHRLGKERSRSEFAVINLGFSERALS